MSGTGEEISQVHWKQQWLENGTLYFHVSMTEPELLAQTTQPTAREPAHALHEHMHLLHISVMVGSRLKHNGCSCKTWSVFYKFETFFFQQYACFLLSSFLQDILEVNLF